MKLKEIVDTLDSWVKNFKKTPNRVYSSEYLLAKRLQLDNYRAEVHTIYEKLNQEQKLAVQPLVRKYQQLKEEIDQIIFKQSKKIKLQLEQSLRAEELATEDSSIETPREDVSISFSIPSPSPRNIKTDNMATFDMNTANKFIPEFDGNQGKYKNFINLVEYMFDSINDTEEKKKLIKFVVRTKFSDKVRNKIAAEKTPETFAELKKITDKHFQPSKNAIAIHGELVTLKQGDKTIAVFAEKIESLIAELNNIHVSKQGEQNKEIVSNINDNLALNAFESGLHGNIKNTVIAAQPNTFADAVKVALQVEATDRSAQKVCYISNFRRQPNNFRNFNQNRFNNNRFNGNRQNSFYRNNNNGNRANEFQNGDSRSNRNNGFRNHNSYRNNGRQNNQNNVGNRNQRNVRIINSENGQEVPVSHQSRDEEIRVQNR